MESYLVQTWNGQVLENEGIMTDLGKARSVCRSNSRNGFTCRIMYGQGFIRESRTFSDHCEVWKNGRKTREGSFAQTTLVTVRE
jgi:hypothetical protein